MSDRRPSGGRW